MTAKERIYFIWAFVGAALAGYGAAHLARIVGRVIPRSENIWLNIYDDAFVPVTIGLVVFFAALALMLKGIDQVKK